MGLHLVEVREPAAFDSAFAAMTRVQDEALLVLGTPSSSSIVNGLPTSRPSTICPRSVEVVRLWKRGVS